MLASLAHLLFIDHREIRLKRHRVEKVSLTVFHRHLSYHTHNSRNRFLTAEATIAFQN